MKSPQNKIIAVYNRYSLIKDPAIIAIETPIKISMLSLLN